MGTFLIALVAFIIGNRFGWKAKEYKLRDMEKDIRNKREILYQECRAAKELNNRVISNLGDLYTEYDALTGVSETGEFTDRDAWLMSMWLD